ncbi:exported hypothetical protein [Rhizobium mesoamericanum STM3625]|uniref:Uncharacterized protein n=1 Tax=Rhizobium mesoamericanum STM3625 TaxID=1211777 RepID=K0Q3S0_9HYPH|nr:exported hypothetical protein [Rhizobium mesoamericanum STM3625]
MRRFRQSFTVFWWRAAMRFIAAGIMLGLFVWILVLLLCLGLMVAQHGHQTIRISLRARRQTRLLVKAANDEPRGTSISPSIPPSTPGLLRSVRPQGSRAVHKRNR